MPPAVSVLLPVFNGKQYLRQAVESVLSQTFEDFELIVCDDGSADGSVEILHEYARQDSRISFFVNEIHSGLFGNYNECLKRASGKYIKPFAQDDILAPRALKVMRQVFEDHAGVVLASCASNIVGAGGERRFDTGIVIPDEIPRNQPVSGQLVIASSLLSLQNFIGEPVRIMFRRYAAGDGFNETMHQLGDLEYWIRILRLGSFYVVNEELCDFRKHAASATVLNARTLRFATDILKIADEFEHEIVTAGHTRHDYLTLRIMEIARLVACLEQTGELQESEIAGAALHEVRSAETDAALRQLLFHSLRLLGAEQLHEERHTGGYHLAQLVRIRERGLRGMLSSRSWRWTRFLREIKLRIKSHAQVDHDPLLAAMEGQDASFRNLLYLKYLRKKIISVRKSSSWFVSSPLRLKI